MGKRPWFAFYPGDWLSSEKVTLMTPEQRGAYIHLLAHLWQSRDCALPDDDGKLAVLSGLGPSWPKNAAVLRECFVVKNGRLQNIRLNTELTEIKKIAQKRKEAAEKRWGKCKSNANASILHMQNDATHTHTSEYVEKTTPPAALNGTGGAATVVPDFKSSRPKPKDGYA